MATGYNRKLTPAELMEWRAYRQEDPKFSKKQYLQLKERWRGGLFNESQAARALEGTPSGKSVVGGKPPVGGNKPLATTNNLPATSQRGLSTGRYVPDFGSSGEKVVGSNTPLQRWFAQNPELGRLFSEQGKRALPLLRAAGVPLAILSALDAEPLGEGSDRPVPVVDWTDLDPQGHPRPRSDEILDEIVRVSEAPTVAEKALIAAEKAPVRTIEIPYGKDEAPIASKTPESSRKGRWGTLDWGDADVEQYQYPEARMPSKA